MCYLKVERPLFMPTQEAISLSLYPWLMSYLFMQPILVLLRILFSSTIINYSFNFNTIQMIGNMSKKPQNIVNLLWSGSISLSWIIWTKHIGWPTKRWSLWFLLGWRGGGYLLVSGDCSSIAKKSCHTLNLILKRRESPHGALETRKWCEWNCLFIVVDNFACSHFI